MEGKGNDHTDARMLFEILSNSDTYQDGKKIYQDYKSKFHNSKDGILVILSSLVQKDILQAGNGAKRLFFKVKEWTRKDNKKALAIIKETFATKIPQEVESYMQSYGFDDLISEVSKQIDFNGVTRKEPYTENELWAMPFIFFLEEAKKYLSWRESDNALSRKFLADLKKRK